MSLRRGRLFENGRAQEIIFGLPVSRYRVPILRSILTAFEVHITTRQRREALLGKLRDLAAIVSLEESLAMESLLARGDRITMDSVEREMADAEMAMDCMICFETVDPLEAREGTITPRCEHTEIVCMPCLESNIEFQMATKQWHMLSCPLCDIRLPMDIVKDNIPRELFEKYRDYMATYHLQSVTGFCWCQHPGCGSGQIQAEGQGNQMVCHKCGYSTCTQCKVNWHLGRTCAELQAQRVRDKDQLSEEAIESITNECPQCKVRIQWDGGCSLMMCTRCGFSFQWRTPSPAAQEPPVRSEATVAEALVPS